MPLSGEIIAVNENLEDSPELINQSPYEEGWIIKIRPDDENEAEELMEKEAYLSFLKGDD